MSEQDMGVCTAEMWPRVCVPRVNVYVNVNNLLAISESDFDNSGEPGPQAEGVNHLETPLRQLHVTHRASSCAERGGHVQLCSKPRGARGIEPETFRRRGQLVLCTVYIYTQACPLPMLSQQSEREKPQRGETKQHTLIRNPCNQQAIATLRGSHTHSRRRCSSKFFQE